MKKLQVPVTIVVLLLVVIGMNSVADWRQQQAKEKTKEVEKTREQAELSAQAAKGQSDSAGDTKKVAFKLPPNVGPQTAPVKIEVFLNTSKDCQRVDPGLQEIARIYGQLVRVEWLSMQDKQVAERSDKLQIGCEAGLSVNGKIEVDMERNGGRVLVAFRGPVGEKFDLRDVYVAINQELKAKGKQTPPAALIKARG